MNRDNNLDWTDLDAKMNPVAEQVRYSFSDHGHLFTKKAFDVYEKDGEGSLWELREAEDGSKHLFALYGDDEQIKSASVWMAQADKAGKNVTLSFRGNPIYRFASDRFSFTPEDAPKFAGYIAGQASNADFIANLVADMPEARRNYVRKLING
jgi:hypothetical protein